MRYISFFVVAFMFVGCSEKTNMKRPFDSFEYSYSSQALQYTVKLNSSDTVYFIKHRPTPFTVSYAIPSEREMDSLISLIQNIEFNKYHSTYNDDAIMDAGTFTFTKYDNKKRDSVFVYGTKAPKQLYKYATQFNEYTKRLNFINVNKTEANLE